MTLVETKQATLNFLDIKNYNKNDFIVSSSNIDAFNAIKSDGNLGVKPFENILIIKGSKSSGKTFLANIYADKINGKFVNSSHDISENLSLYNNFILDDANLIREEEIFHIINISKENEKNLVIFLDINFSAMLPDLKSRINSIKTCYLQKPDDNLIEIFISSILSKKAISVSKETIDFIKKRVTREFFEIQNFINDLDKYCLENKINLNVKSVSSFLKSYNQK